MERGIQVIGLEGQGQGVEGREIGFLHEKAAMVMVKMESRVK